MKYPILFVVLSSLLVWSACSEDNDMPEEMDKECTEQYTFSGEVQALINATCAYSGCHAGGLGLPDFRSYEGLVATIESGRFQNRVLQQMSMPPSNAQGPISLTEEELHLLSCWIEQGYPED
jgi:uncharacterized membrane protein